MLKFRFPHFFAVAQTQYACGNVYNNPECIPEPKPIDDKTPRPTHHITNFNVNNTSLEISGPCIQLNSGRIIGAAPPFHLKKKEHSGWIIYSDDGGQNWIGHICDLRYVVGTAVYTASATGKTFTPPKGPLTLTGGTYSSTTNVNTSIPSGHTKILFNFNSSNEY